MYVITEWLERYEVNDKGQPARPGDKLRVRPLKYVRSKIHGLSQGAGFRAMQHRAGDRTYEVFGIFQKFLEIAGSHKNLWRGTLLNARGLAASNSDLAFILNIQIEKVDFAIQVLMDPGVAWIEKIPDPEFQKFQENREKDNEGQIPEIPGKSGVLYNETKRNENETEQNRTKGLPENPGEDSTKARASSLSTRLDFANRLRELLRPKNKADVTALWNVQHWAAKYGGDDIHSRILALADDCRGGRNPMAVFFSRMDKELEYRPRAQKAKQEAE